jgi:hypothetical protein
VLRSPRVWLVAAGGWLILAGLAHSTAHLWYYVLEHDLIGRRFVVEAMKQASSADPLNPSLWRQFRAFSMGFALLFYFTGVGNLLLLWTKVPMETLRVFTLLETVFWTLAFGLFAFVDPVIQPIVVTAVAVALHGIAFVTAHQETKTGFDPDQPTARSQESQGPNSTQE